MKFSLGGDRGLAIFAAGSPSSRLVACPPAAPVNDADEDDSDAEAGKLKLKKKDSEYEFGWKTEKTWKGACRELVVGFVDGTVRVARFRFK